MCTNEKKWAFREITPNIFLLSFDSYYDLAMHFVRAQEFYESNNIKLRNTHFTLVDFMEWYAKTNDGTFSYPDDWAGFNVPGWVFKKVLNKKAIKDWNKYDEFMFKVTKQLQKRVPNNNPCGFYLIGASTEDSKTVDHEIAHGLYYTNSAFKSEMQVLTESFQKQFDSFTVYLRKIGYDESVLKDEFQAYFSTGLGYDGKKFLKKKKVPYKKATKKFKKVFKKWKSDLVNIRDISVDID